VIQNLIQSLNTQRTLVTTIAVRELVSMFRVPAGWIIIALFAFLSAVLFLNQTLIPGQPGSMRYFFIASAWLLIPIAPAISMRLMSEEYRTGSFESLRTTPAGDWAVALGKFIGAVLFLILMLTPSLIYPIVLAIVSSPAPDAGPIVAGYLMLILVGSLYLSIGLFASSLTSSQTLAFLGTMMALVLFIVVTSVLAPRAGSTLSPILDRLSVISRAGEFGKGIIDSGTIAFFVIGCLWMVALSAAVLESKRLARKRSILIFMASFFVLTSGIAVFFAGYLTSEHRVRIDVTSTSAHKLSQRASNMVDALPGPTRIVLAINQNESDQRALDLVSDVLETYDRSSPLLTSRVIDLATADGINQTQQLINELRAQESDSIQSNQQTIEQASQSLSAASTQLLQSAKDLQSIRDAIDGSTTAGATNRAFFDQRSALVRLGAQDLSNASSSLESDPVSGSSMLDAQLAQLEDLRNQLSDFANAPEITPAAKAGARSLNSRLDTLIDQLAVTSDRLARLIPIDADRVATALETGESLLIIGPPETGIAAIDLETLLPPTQLLEQAGISPAGVIGPRTQELIASALAQLVIQNHPIVVFVHAGEPGQLLGTPQLLSKTVNHFKQQGIDTIEWAPLHESDRPSLVELDPIGQRPIVFIMLAADSAAGGGETGITGARRATSLANIAQQLIDQGESVLISMNPSIFGSFGDTDPMVAVLEPFGIIPDPTKALLSQRIASSKRIADPAMVVVPTIGNDQQIHPIGEAVQGLSTLLPWSIPINIDPRVGAQATPIITLQGSEQIWGEHDWITLWSTPAQSRQYLQDQPIFEESKDIRRDQWTIAAGAERLIDSDQQRIVVVGSNSWIYDALTFGQSQLVDGRITTAFPGNLTLLESSISWLAGLDQLIAPGIQSRPIATIKPLDASQLSFYRWILLGAVPGAVLLIGIGTRIVFG
jgi:ABC-2 type transport system permease protein